VTDLQPVPHSADPAEPNSLALCFSTAVKDCPSSGGPKSIKCASWAKIGGKNLQKITEIRKNLQKITKINKNEPLLSRYELGYLRI
jgi:hypothetical protein